jgi:hypothetical protein
VIWLSCLARVLVSSALLCLQSNVLVHRALYSIINFVHRPYLKEGNLIVRNDHIKLNQLKHLRHLALENKHDLAGELCGTK